MSKRNIGEVNIQGDIAGVTDNRIMQQLDRSWSIVVGFEHYRRQSQSAHFLIACLEQRQERGARLFRMPGHILDGSQTAASLGTFRIRRKQLFKNRYSPLALAFFS